MPQTFGRYELLGVLGRGGMGEVYRAHDTVRQRDVALKLLPEHLAGDERFLARFRRESRLAAQLSDPHIIPIHDFGEVDGRLFIDMRLVLGADLGSVLAERGPLSPSVAVDILAQVASALDAAHADALIHRDVKPSNVMLTGLSADLEQRPPFAYLVDFGIARSTTQMTALTDTSSTTIGTVAYMAPERINGEVGDGRGDVYALACVLFESLTGTPPYVGELVPLIYQHMNAEPPRPSERTPSLPRAFDAVIAQGLAKDPDQRFDTAGELAVAARQALRGAPTGPAPPPAPVPAQRPLPAGPRPRPQPSGAGVSRRLESSLPPPAAPPRPIDSEPADTRATRVDSGSGSAVADAKITDPPLVTFVPPAESYRSRETVTLLFAELDGAARPVTGKSRAALPADRRRVLLTACEELAGVEVDGEAGAVLVAFLDPAAAVSAAADAQRRLAALDAVGLDGQIRIGVHAGPARRRAEGYWGPDVRYVARLGAAARGGQVLVSDTAHDLAAGPRYESLGRHAVRDFPTPREIFRLVLDGSSAGDVAPPRTLEAPLTNLPSAADPLIGRDAELTDLVGRLTRGQRLVTVTGPAGSGKTRFVVEAGLLLTVRFASVRFVPLDSAPAADGVLIAIAHALGLPDLVDADPFARLRDVLRERRVLLVLDAAAPDANDMGDLTRLLSSCPGLHVLVTSEAPLRVPTEDVLPLAGLELPVEPAASAGGRGAAGSTAAPAVQLLLAHAAVAGADIELGPVAADAVARLCHRLEGLPLALQLAAARLRDVDADTLAQRLADEPEGPVASDDNGPALPRALRAVLRWSAGLLSPSERRLFALLAGFTDAFSLETAEAAFGALVDELAGLVDVGLVVPGDDGRYVLRAPVRRCAAELAAAAGDPDAGVRAIAEALARAAERIEPRWMSAEGDGRSLLAPEQVNIRSALDWAREHEPRLQLRLAAATAWLFERSGQAAASRAHLTRAIERSTDPRSVVRCRTALTVLGASTPGPSGPDPSASLAVADEWHEIGDADREATSVAHAAHLYARFGDGHAALAAADRAGEAATRCTDPRGMATLTGLLRARAWSALGRHDEARTLADGLLDRSEPESFERLWALGVSAENALAGARPADALAAYGAALPLLERFHITLDAVALAGRIGAALLDLERNDDAAAVLAICEEVHGEWSWPAPPDMVALTQQVRERVDPTRLASARARAASYSTAEALAWVGRLARGEAETRAVRPSR